MSFSDYMDSLGANKQYLTGVYNPPNPSDDVGEGNPGYRLQGSFKTPYNFGDKAQVWSPQGNNRFDSRNVIPYGTPTGSPTNPSHIGGANGRNKLNYAEGYVDRDGGFLGYGSNYNQLQSNGQLNNQYATYSANEPGRLAGVEAQNIANQRARFQYEQDYQAAQAAKLAAQAQQPHFQGQGLMGMGQAPQQSSMGRGSGFAPGQQYAGGMGRGSGAGLIGGMGRGGGQ